VRTSASASGGLIAVLMLPETRGTVFEEQGAPIRG
jgi:hypothetical protein